MSAVQLSLLHHISRELIFKQVCALGIELQVQLNLSGALLKFLFPSPTPVQYLGASMFTEAGGDDNGFLLIPPQAGAPYTTLCKIPSLCLDL